MNLFGQADLEYQCFEFGGPAVPYRYGRVEGLNPSQTDAEHGNLRHLQVSVTGALLSSYGQAVAASATIASAPGMHQTMLVKTTRLVCYFDSEIRFVNFMLASDTYKAVEYFAGKLFEHSMVP
jgi:hypothetical protein